MNLFNKKRKVSILFNNKYYDVDEDFWENLQDEDIELKEAIEEYVRDCDDFSIWVD